MYNCLKIFACQVWRSAHHRARRGDRGVQNKFSMCVKWEAIVRKSPETELLEILYHIARNASDRVSDCSRHHRLTLRAARAGSRRHRGLCGEELEEEKKKH